MTTATSLRLIEPDPGVGEHHRRPPSELLAALGYDEKLDAIVFVEDAPVYGGRFCAAPGCELATDRAAARFCRSHSDQVKTLDVSEHDVDLAVLQRKNRVEFLDRRCRICKVAGHERSAALDGFGLCLEHLTQFRDWVERAPSSAMVAEWIEAAAPVPLPRIGYCAIADCERPRRDDIELCRGHFAQWRRHCRRFLVAEDDDTELARFAAIGFLPDSRVLALWRLHPLFHDEFLESLTVAAEIGAHLQIGEIRAVVRSAALNATESLAAWQRFDPAGNRVRGSRAAKFLAAALRRARAGPESERHAEVWDMRVWGCNNGSIAFTEISQPWLNELAKAWAFADLTNRPTTANGATTKSYVKALGVLSGSLRRRPDAGDDASVLGRHDIERFLDHMNGLVINDGLSNQSRVQLLHRVRGVLGWARETGFVDSNEHCRMLNHSFTIRMMDVPSRNDVPDRRRAPEEEAGRAFTAAQMRVLLEALPDLEAAHGARGRRCAELLMLTGRRPSEILRLGATCLRHHERRREDGDVERQPLLHYYASKVNRWHSLFIDPGTAEVVENLIDLAREEFPHTPVEELKLFPSPHANRNGRRPVGNTYTKKLFNTWTAFPAVAQALEGRARSVPYDLRHSFAQMHADAGVPIDVLQDLMSHVSSDTTRVYYEISTSRRVDAVAVMRRFRFDRNGIRVDVGQNELLDLEYQRAGLAGVAVPLGECSHPSMLKPGDQRCPVRFRCLGCSQFSTSVDRLPELRAYLEELLASRESILAGDLLDEWAKQDALPHSDEIGQVRALIERATSILDDLDDDDRAQVTEAVAIYRGVRDSLGARGHQAPVTMRLRAGGPVLA